MKEQEKQIEEMAKVIGHCYCDKECQNKCAYCDISSRNEAKKLYENGFRKLPEDSVVLSKEEYKMLLEEARKAKNQCIKIELETIMKAEEKASKETAEKIYYKAEKKTYYQDGGYYDKDRYYLDMEDLKEIIRSCGVEIKE